MRICDRCESRNVEQRYIALGDYPERDPIRAASIPEKEWEPDLCDNCFTRLRKTIEDYLSPAKAIRATEFNGP